MMSKGGNLAVPHNKRLQPARIRRPEPAPKPANLDIVRYFTQPISYNLKFSNHDETLSDSPA